MPKFFYGVLPRLLFAASLTSLLAACGSSKPGSSSSAPSSSSSSVVSSSSSSSSVSSSGVVSSSSSTSGQGCNQMPDGSNPYCMTGALADPDGDGWGWENEASCIVPDSAADPMPGTCVVDTPQAGGGESSNRITYNGQQIYLNGVNVAWINFARDFGNGFDETRFRQMLNAVNSAGGNSIRWWVHTDGTLSPQYSGAGLVNGPGGSIIQDLQHALDIAAEYGIYIVPSMWSFDMLRDNSDRNPPNANNYRILSNDVALQAYIDYALVPIVQAVNGHSQLIAWELFNEPENMTESWFRTDNAFYGGEVPTLAMLQRTQAKMTAAIHRAAAAMGQTALVTTGSKSMGKYNSDVAGGTNLYRDDRMIAAADGDALAVLDFYEPHYYNNEGRNGAWSPFHHDASYWGVDKPIVVGEFHVETLNVLNDAVQGDDLCQRLVENGYAGGWSWTWSENGSALVPCMRNVDTNANPPN